jgi:hypothetical protein
MKETGQAGYDADFSGNALHVVSWPEVEAMCSALGNARAGSAVLGLRPLQRSRRASQRE